MQSGGNRACSGFMGGVGYEVCRLMALIAIYRVVQTLQATKLITNMVPGYKKGQGD